MMVCFFKFFCYECRYEVVGEVVEVGLDVIKYKVGDKVGVGVIVGCCRNCNFCKMEEE